MKRSTGFLSQVVLATILALASISGCSLLSSDDLITRVPTAAVSTLEVAVATDANTPDPIAATAEEAAATPTTAAAPTIAGTTTPSPSPTLTAPPVYTYNVIASYPHDPNAFTQGLDIDDGNLYEGTGLWGQSSLRLVNLETGAVLLEESLSAEYFGEGITVLGDRIYQITWQENTGFVYDQNNFELLQTFSYPTEGWGITHDGTRLIVSDGTSTIYFWDPETLAEIGRINVSDNEGPVIQLNELEYVNGEIWANVWLTDRIARISPETGQVLGWIDLTGLLDTSNLTEPVDVLNGIAFDESNGRLFVTGKLWPALYEIELVASE
jgi:glutamine cyclotransferase